MSRVRRAAGRLPCDGRGLQAAAGSQVRQARGRVPVAARGYTGHGEGPCLLPHGRGTSSL
jgi:hypothetical protein